MGKLRGIAAIFMAGVIMVGGAITALSVSASAAGRERSADQNR